MPPVRYDHSGLYKDDRVHTKTDILESRPQQQAQKLLLPQIAKMTRNAIGVTPVPVEYFQRLKAGRRCSCFSIEDEPQGLCVLCFGTGIVGGYAKYGTKLHIFDVTSPHVNAINVAPDYSKPTRPINWTLMPTAVYGYLQTTIPLRGNTGVLDILRVEKTNITDAFVEPWIRGSTDADWVLLNEANLKARIQFHELALRIVFRRLTPQSPLPRLAGIRIGYKLISRTTLQIDVPRFTRSMTLEEFGIYDSFTSQTFVFDDTLKHITTEDWVYNVRDSTRWKIIEAQDNKPLGVTTSWDTQARLIQTFEPTYRVPVGNILSPCEQPPKGVFSMWAETERSEALKGSDFGPPDKAHQQVQVGLPKPGQKADQTRGPK